MYNAKLNLPQVVVMLAKAVMSLKKSYQQACVHSISVKFGLVKNPLQICKVNVDIYVPP